MSIDEIYKFMRELDENWIQGHMDVDDVHKAFAALRLAAYGWSKSRQSAEGLSCRNMALDIKIEELEKVVDEKSKEIDVLKKNIEKLKGKK